MAWSPLPRESAFCCQCQRVSTQFRNQKQVHVLFPHDRPDRVRSLMLLTIRTILSSVRKAHIFTWWMNRLSMAADPYSSPLRNSVIREVGIPLARRRFADIQPTVTQIIHFEFNKLSTANLPRITPRPKAMSLASFIVVPVVWRISLAVNALILVL